MRSDAPEVFRPARLRRLGDGTLDWAGRSFDWTAFAAPLGGPLTDAVQLSGPLPWADVRYLLDQLVEEFRTAEGDGTVPERLGIDQVWVEPNGRVQLLDCPIANQPSTVSRSPLILLREVTSLTLEGHPRATDFPVRAPVPPHAVPVLDKLFTDGGYRGVAELQRELAETQMNRPEVTPAVRAAQLGIQAALLALALTVMFAVAAAAGPLLVMLAQERAKQADAALSVVEDSERRAKLAADHPTLVEPLKSPRLVTRLEDFRERKRAEAELRRTQLLGLQRWVLDQREQQELAEYPVQVRELVQWAGAPSTHRAVRRCRRGRARLWELFAGLAAVPFAFVLSAGVLRGGVSMLVAGIAIVRADGRRATRGQCGLRALIVWLPVTILLFGAAGLQFAAPDRIHLALALWLLAAALLPVYIVIALRFPTRPPQDRLLGTYLVPE